MLRFRIRDLLVESEEFRATGRMPALDAVAKDAGLSRQILSKMCKPGYVTSTANIEKLLEYFGIGPHELHRLVEYTPGPKGKSPKNGKGKPR